MKKVRVIIASLLLIFCSACAKQSANSSNQIATQATTPEPSQKITSTSVVKATTTPLDISAGHSADAIVQIDVDQGYHVNANPPSYPYLKATEIDVPAADGLSVNFTTYPNALTRKVAFAEKPLAVYEGRIPVKINLKADKSAAKGLRNLSGKLRVQACDEQVCYAPGTIDLLISVTIK